MTNFEKVGSCNRVTVDFLRNAFRETNSYLTWERGTINNKMAAMQQVVDEVVDKVI